MSEPRRLYDLATELHDREYPMGAPRRTVLICTSRRSGSTLLGEALYRAGGLGCPLEYLHPGFRSTFAARWGEPDLPGYLRAMYRHRVDAAGTLGVKLFWPDVLSTCAERHPEQAEWFSRNLIAAPEFRERVFTKVSALIGEFFPNPTFVHLWRVDQLRQAISDVRAVQSGRWRSFDQAGAAVHPAASYPTASGPVAGAGPAGDLGPDTVTAHLTAFAYQRQQWRDWFAWAGVTPIEVTYEQLVAEYATTCRDLAQRLGGTHPADAATAPRLVRQSDAVTEQTATRYLTQRLGRQQR